MTLLQKDGAVSHSAIVKPPSVGMGQTLLLRQDESAATVLGSCIGLVIYHRRLKVAAFAHIVLPTSEGRPGSPGKFADTAIPHLLDLLAKEEACNGLNAKIVGGAHMFAGKGPLQIGESNIEMVKKLLQRNGVPIVAECVGGTKGRRVTFHCDSRELHVEIAGQPVAVI